MRVHRKNMGKESDDRTAIRFMLRLKKLCTAYKAELDALQSEEESFRKNMHTQMEAAASEIQERAARQKSVRTEEETQTQVLLDWRLEKLETMHEDLQKYFAAAGGFCQNTSQGTNAGPNEFPNKKIAAAFSNQEQRYNELHRIIWEKKENQKRTTAACIQSIEARARSEHDTLKQMWNNSSDSKQRELKMKRQELMTEFHARRDASASPRILEMYEKAVTDSGKKTAEFVCATSVPRQIHLGSVSMQLTNVKPPHDAIESFLSGYGGQISRNSQGGYFITLPYCQSTQNGISLFFCHSVTSRARYHHLMQDVLLKLFMSFPPAGLEALMIDPLELGETFSAFTRLGDERSRMISTKIWSQERDISEQIKTLRNKVETVTQTYGTDHAARIRKEPFRVLAVTDFPTGFSRGALDDLRAIVRKGASCGVCIVICANQQEFEKLQSTQKDVYEEIKNVLHVVKEQDGKMVLEEQKPNKVFLTITPGPESEEEQTNIIKKIAEGIHGTEGKCESFQDLFQYDIDDPRNWFTQNTVNELSIPLAIQGADSVVRMVVGRTEGKTEHHALIAGEVGSGKSTLLHTIIMSTLLNFNPDEVQMYLVDFKDGVEFKSYSPLNLPAVRVVAIGCEAEFGLNILEELRKEMNRRFKLFRQEANQTEISAYRKVTGKKLPKLLVIFDELQELFRGSTDSTGNRVISECVNLLGELLTLGRAAGIHFVMASQNFNLINSAVIQELQAHCGYRIAIKSTQESASSVLDGDNDGFKQLMDGAAGAAVFNDANGRQSGNKICQIAYLHPDQRTKYLKMLSARQNSPAFAAKYPYKTRVLLTNAEDDAFSEFNLLLSAGEPVERDPEEQGTALILGESFEMKRRFRPALYTDRSENLMMIGANEELAAGLFYFTILSVLYDGACRGSAARNAQSIWLIDLSQEEDYEDEHKTSFRHLKQCFRGQMDSERLRNMERIIDDAYASLERRMDGREDMTQRRFLLLFGIDRAYKLLSKSVTSDNMYRDDPEDGMDVHTKLSSLMQYGPRYGISCVFWGESMTGVTHIIGDKLHREFRHRIAFSADPAAFEQLVMERNPGDLRSNTCVYMNVDEDVKNQHFRPYEIPGKSWVQNLSRAYQKCRQQEEKR